MLEPGWQAPVTESLSACNVPHDNNERDPLVDQLLQFREQDLPRSCRASSCGEEARREGEERERLKEQLLATKHENDELRQRVKQQFHDLGELDSIMGELEAQVDGHEAVIKQQGHRIQQQEEVIRQMSATTQQYLAELLLSAFKNRYS